MSKQVFAPPVPHIVPPSQETLSKLKRMTRKEYREFKKSEDYKKYVQPVLKREKMQQRNKVREWMWNKGIVVLNTVLALIAAVTGIIALLR